MRLPARTGGHAQLQLRPPVRLAVNRRVGRRANLDRRRSRASLRLRCDELPAAAPVVLDRRSLPGSRRRIFLFHQRSAGRLETSPRQQQNRTDCHKKDARPVRSDPQESHSARWRLQRVTNRLPGGIRTAKWSAPNGSVCRVQESAENEQRAESDQEHSRLSIHRCPRTRINRGMGGFVPSSWGSSVPRQLPPAPMMVFAIGIEHALYLAV